MIVKIAIVSIVCALLVMHLKNLKSEYGQLLLVAVGVFLFFFAVEYLTSIKGILESLSSKISIQKTYITILLKMIGIAYVCEFASNLCKDAGCQTIASQMELIGKLAMLLISSPIITSLMELIVQLI